MEFKKGELFSGPGGLSLGAKLAEVTDKNGNVHRITHEWAYDIDPNACETFRNNICPKKPESVFCADITEVDLEKTKKIDALVFGFPCNDFSNVGKKKGISGEYGPLYSYGVKILSIHEPSWFLAENVGGLHSADEGKTFKKILSELQNAGTYGYNLTVHLYKFEEYGIPQKRHRIIIVGIRKDLGLEFKIPKPTTKDPLSQISSKEALEVPPITNNAFNHEFTKHPLQIVERLKHIPPGQNAWYDGIPDELKLNVKGAKLSNIYKRLDPKEPAYTVTGSGGGGTHMYHYEECRALTNRERARLQSFPDNFKFYGGKDDVRKQVGMAVPPMGAKLIFEAVLKTFAGIPYEYVDSKWDIEF